MAHQPIYRRIGGYNQQIVTEVGCTNLVGWSDADSRLTDADIDERGIRPS